MRFAGCSGGAGFRMVLGGSGVLPQGPRCLLRCGTTSTSVGSVNHERLHGVAVSPPWRRLVTLLRGVKFTHVGGSHGVGVAKTGACPVTPLLLLSVCALLVAWAKYRQEQQQ